MTSMRTEHTAEARLTAATCGVVGGVIASVWLSRALESLLYGIPAADGLYLAQIGSKHIAAKPWKSFGSGVLEVLADHRGDTFRSVYTIRLAGTVYVLHAFQKKSTQGAENS
jgi:Gp49-like protein DUF891